MSDRVLHLYLAPAMRADAEAGQVNIVNRIAAAVAPAGLRLAFHDDTEAERQKAARRAGWSLFHMQSPIGPRTLCLRRAYHYPFWQIEAVAERWQFDVALARFDGALVDAAQARGFARRWREKLLGDPAVTREGFIFVPLQGRLTEHRSFQAMSPLGMIRATLAADPARPVVARLHPKEVYTAADHRALAALAEANPRFQMSDAPGPGLLAACDYVVTQNSAMALSGFFLRKPAVLFAGIDFHHIAGSVPRDGLAAAFASVAGEPPDFDAYLWWFFKRHTINGGAPEAEDQIRARFARHGWQI